MAALIKALMKPSLTPCFFANYSPNSFLMFIKPLISISLNVVNMALLFYASFSLDAILYLILLIATLVSVLDPLIS